MKNINESLVNQNKDLIGIGIGIVFILMLPLIGMQFSTDVDWNSFDFAIAGTLLFGMGFIYAVLSRLTKVGTYRIVIGFGLLFILGIIWAELAVGIFGSPFAGS